ncbi:hypothetical protein LguiB_013219 [Lonicera macranthoides]
MRSTSEVNTSFFPPNQNSLQLPPSSNKLLYASNSWYKPSYKQQNPFKSFDTEPLFFLAVDVRQRGRKRNRRENPKGASTPSKDPISFVCAYRRGVVFSTLERQQHKVLSTVFITFNSNLIQERKSCVGSMAYVQRDNESRFRNVERGERRKTRVWKAIDMINTIGRE